MTFCKYSFPDKSIWNTHKSQITDSEGNAIDCAIVEIGELNNGYSVDIMWYGDIPKEFNAYEVFPEPCGIHVFSGCEDLYGDRFCEFNPDSQYCKLVK